MKMMLKINTYDTSALIYKLYYLTTLPDNKLQVIIWNYFNQKVIYMSLDIETYYKEFFYCKK